MPPLDGLTPHLNIDRLAAILRTTRRNAGLTQAAVAEAAAISRAQIAKAETGRLANLRSLQRIADALNLGDLFQLFRQPPGEASLQPLRPQTKIAATNNSSTSPPHLYWWVEGETVIEVNAVTTNGTLTAIGNATVPTAIIPTAAREVCMVVLPGMSLTIDRSAPLRDGGAYLVAWRQIPTIARVHLTNNGGIRLLHAGQTSDLSQQEFERDVVILGGIVAKFQSVQLCPSPF